MRHETFRGRDLDKLVLRLRRELGEDAMILDSRIVQEDGEAVYEIRGVRAGEVGSVLERLASGEASESRRAPTPGTIRPRVVAVVGPAGGGKTSTVMKLALSAEAFGGRSVGLVTLDTFRVGALEELGTYAEIAGLPLEVVYNRRDVPAALERMREMDVVLVDSPGRVPGGDDRWAELLDAFEPDEVHLAIPAAYRASVIRETASRFARCRPTHLLPTMTDTIVGGELVAEMVERLQLPCRWLACGQDLAGDLVRSRRHLLEARGLSAAGAA